jgi:hypothetical protein
VGYFALMADQQMPAGLKSRQTWRRVCLLRCSQRRAGRLHFFRSGSAAVSAGYLLIDSQYVAVPSMVSWSIR